LRKIYIIGQIDSAAYEKFSRRFDRLTESSFEAIEIELHSEGGSSYDGLAFYGKISTSRVPTIITCFGMAHSAAIAILAAGTIRRCSPEANFMVHESTSKLKGTSSSLMKQAEQAMDDERAWDSLMERSTGTPASFWRALHKEESFLNARQALQYGLVDTILKGNSHV
jgi:ATP-dependent Clp protease, protease subunit